MLVKVGRLDIGDTVDIIAGDWAGAAGRVTELASTPHAWVDVSAYTDEKCVVMCAVSALRHHAWPLSEREVEGMSQEG
jgi:ribosomal protein L24